MRLKFFIVLLPFTMVSGCVTYNNQSPRIEGTLPAAIHGVRLTNGNKEKEERIFFSDGITTLTGYYANWTNYLIMQFARGMNVTSDEKKKTLEVTTNSISCSGSFVTNCYVSASIQMGKVEKITFNTENVYGYGGLPTAKKALNQIADMMRASPQVNKYIHNE